MMVFLAVVLVLIAIVIVVLWQKVKISYELKLENFKITFKSKIMVFGKTLFDSANKKEKTEETNTETKEKRKMTLSDITTVKDAAKPVVSVVFKLVKCSVGIDSFETDVRVALLDPMDNGVAYGIICGVINNLYVGIMRTHPQKEYFLDITHDFKSGEGLILENKGTIYVRPGKVLGIAAAAWVGKKNLRKAVKYIKKLFTKEENEK